MARGLMGVQPGSQGTTTLSDGSAVRMPLLTYRARSFAALLTISAAKARALLPGDALRPVRISPRRALILVQAMEYTDKTTDPYRELAVSIPVLRSPRLEVPGGSLAAWLARSGGGSYITHLAVDTEEARLIGWEILGFPKFLATIELGETRNEHIAEASLDGQSILTLAVAKAARHRSQRRDFSIYSLSPVENRLFHIPYQSEATVGATRGSRSARLHLGSHPVAGELRDLHPAAAPLLALDIPRYTLISNRPDAKIDVGDWRDPRGVYRDLRAATASRSRPRESAASGRTGSQTGSAPGRRST